MNKVVIISVHPDDETLGAGGTILKHKNAGDEIYWLIITGIKGIGNFSQEQIDTRDREIKDVASKYGFTDSFLLDVPTMSLSSSSLLTLVPKISDIFSRIQPSTIYLINRSDAHSDHRIAFDAVMACTKSFRYPYIRTVLMYECISETEFAPALLEKVFIPNYFVDISDYLEMKLEIMGIYKSELGEHPFPRSFENIKALATFRGASVGVRYAEAFQLLKHVDK